MRRGLPQWLVPSAKPELVQVLNGTKPAARLYVGSRTGDMRRWARRLGLFASTDRDGYVVLSRKSAASRRILELDRRPGRHTLALGMFLGYPRCCSRAAARCGDEGIDAMHDKIAARRFHGRFEMINPAAYRQGGTILSHVPCSHRCVASLSLAARAGRC